MKRILVCTAVVWALAGCAQTTRHRIATILFDGVPPFEEEGQDLEGERVPGPEARKPDSQIGTPVTPVIYKHSPYDRGSCGTCHDTGASNGLVKDGNDLCMTCHAGIVIGG